MSQQITIIVMIDIPAALKSGSLEDNVYLIDNLRTEGSEGVGTGNLITAVHGSHWRDGSQASDIVLNWMVWSISSLPPTLPKTYLTDRSKAIDYKLLQKIRTNSEILDCGSTNNATKQADKWSLSKEIANAGTSALICNEFEDTVDLGLKTFTVYGKPFISHNDESELNYLLPYISQIAGEAVEQEVIFPAQYGCPVPINDGWYWSATVDTAKIGIYDYTMKIVLYEARSKGNEQMWYPVEMSYKARIKVTDEPQVNGFTGGGVGFLPMI